MPAMPAAETQPYHVTLRAPMSLKIGDGSHPAGWRREAIDAIDATISCNSSTAITGTVELRAHTLYRTVGGGQPPIAMRVTVYVPMDNIASIVAQPLKAP
jgi:hypothetical protein